MIRNITVQEALEALDSGAVLVDVRSEGEFAEVTIPGAINIPLFNNQERAQIGTVYKQVSPTAARRLGLRLVAPKLPALLERFEQLAPAGEKVILFCWRGGMRSQFVAYMLEQMNFNVCRIIGGFKSYRRYVNSYLGTTLPHRAVVLHGLTGVGKTEIIKRLPAYGVPVLDLETLAAHRGSVFGKVGMPASPGQKMFEGLIVQALRAAEKYGTFVVECESRRLGRLLVPPPVMQAIRDGYRVLLYAGMPVRVERSLGAYLLEGSPDALQPLLEAVDALVKYLGKTRVEQLKQWIMTGQYRPAVEFLLRNYYDPLYKYPAAPSEDYHLCVDTVDLERAAAMVAAYVKSLPEFGRPVRGGEQDVSWSTVAPGEGETGPFPGGCRECHENSP